MAYAQITVSQLVDAVYERLGNNRVFWREDEAYRFLNEGLRVWNLLTGLWRGRIDMGLTVANQTWYALPVGISYGLRMELNGQPLDPTNLWDLDYGQPGWESDSAAVPMMWAPAGLSYIALWPKSLAGGESLVLQGVLPAPQYTIADVASFVDLGRDDQDSVADYAAHVMRCKEGGQEFEASQEQLKQFLKGAASRNGLLMQSSPFRRWMGLVDDSKRRMRPVTERVGAR